MHKPTLTLYALLVAAMLAVAIAGCRGASDEGTTASAEAAEGTGYYDRDDDEPDDEAAEPPPPIEPITGVEFETDLDMVGISKMVVEISTDIGEREAHTKALGRTARYIKQRYTDLGYEAEITEFKLPDGKKGKNVVVSTPAEGPRLVIAAHMDTVAGCPCANDDATGIATMIDIARILKERGLDDEIPVQFVFLGAEEEIEGFEGHGYSALELMEQLPESEVERMAAAVWLDKLGRGDDFLALVIEGTDEAAARLLTEAIAEGKPTPTLKVVPRWSEEMAFEDAGIPTVWLEWSKDRHLHKPTDTWESIDWEKVAAAADATLSLVLSKSWVSEA